MPNQIPEDLAAVLKSAGLSDFFAGCTGPHQNEYLKWIGEAKKVESRQKRIAHAMKMLAAKRAEEEKRTQKKSQSK